MSCKSLEAETTHGRRLQNKDRRLNAVFTLRIEQIQNRLNIALGAKSTDPNDPTVSATLEDCKFRKVVILSNQNSSFKKCTFKYNFIFLP